MEEYGAIRTTKLGEITSRIFKGVILIRKLKVKSPDNLFVRLALAIMLWISCCKQRMSRIKDVC